jgi:hypothetical protein
MDLLPPLPRDPTPEERPAHDALVAALGAIPCPPGFEASQRRGGVNDPLRIDLGEGVGARIHCEVHRPLRAAHGAAETDAVILRFFLSDSALTHGQAVEAAGYGPGSLDEVGAPVSPAALRKHSQQDAGNGDVPLWRFIGPAGGSTVPTPWSVIPSSSTPEEANLLVFLGLANNARRRRADDPEGMPTWADTFEAFFSKAELQDFLSLLTMVLLREVEDLASAEGWPENHLTTLRRQIPRSHDWLQALALDLLEFEFPGKPDSLHYRIRRRALREWAPSGG